MNTYWVRLRRVVEAWHCVYAADVEVAEKLAVTEVFNEDTYVDWSHKAHPTEVVQVIGIID